MQRLLQFFILCFLPGLLSAGGAFVYEITTAEMRLGTAGWSSRANDPSTVFTNPAGMTRLNSPQLQAGAGALFSHLVFDPNDNTQTRGSKGHGNLWLPIGSSFLVYPYSECIRFGFASLGYFGSSLKYNHKWVGRYYVQKTLLQGLSLVPAVAYKLNDFWSFGFGLNVMYGFFRQRSAINNRLDGLEDGWVNLHDYRWGVGYLAGVLYEPCNTTRFGIQYLSHVRLHLRAVPKFRKLGPQLEALFEEVGIIGSQIDLDVKVPESVMFSAYHQLNCGFAVMADIGWQRWQNFQKTIFAPVDNASITFTPKYKNSWHFAVGAEWYWSPSWTLSGGVAYDTSCVKPRNRTFNYPVGKQWRFGTGARFTYSENLLFDIATELLWQGKMFADQSRGPLGGRVSGHYHNNYVWFLASDIIWKF